MRRQAVYCLSVATRDTSNEGRLETISTYTPFEASASFPTSEPCDCSTMIMRERRGPSANTTRFGKVFSILAFTVVLISCLAAQGGARGERQDYCTRCPSSGTLTNRELRQIGKFVVQIHLNGTDLLAKSV
jgi:hypothetical protein